jgi:hypothetical protein
VRNLSEGVNARVGSTGSVNDDTLTHDVSKGEFDGILNRIFPRLTLPSGEGGAVVGDLHFEADHPGWRLILLPAVRRVQGASML